MKKLVLLSLMVLPVALSAAPAKKVSSTKKSSYSRVADMDSQEGSNGSAANGNAAPVVNQIQWTSNYSVGMQQAAKEGKNVFLYFTGSDWCGWCKKLDQEVLSQAEFANATGSKFVFVKLDYPMNKAGDEAQVQQNARLKQQYGVTGFPTVVLLDSKGTFIAETGYRSGGPRSYAAYIEQLIQSPNS
jgi:thioredoxin-related protein